MSRNLSDGELATGLVERWMTAQLALEREYFRVFGRVSTRRERLLTLNELDIISQLPDAGSTAAEIATDLNLEPEVVRRTVARLVRRGLLARQLRGGRASRVVRTPAADDLISVFKTAQTDLMASLLSRLEPDLQHRLLRLMETEALRPQSTLNHELRAGGPEPAGNQPAGGVTGAIDHPGPTPGPRSEGR